MVDGWKKFFADGTIYDGADTLVASKQASWSRSRNTDIIKTEISLGAKKLCILGLGEYWQSDDLISVFQYGPVPGVIQTRRIEKRIEASDKFIQILDTSNSLSAIFTQTLPKGSFVIIEDKHINKWLVLELSAGSMRYFISDVKI